MYTVFISRTPFILWQESAVQTTPTLSPDVWYFGTVTFNMGTIPRRILS